MRRRGPLFGNAHHPPGLSVSRRGFWARTPQDVEYRATRANDPSIAHPARPIHPLRVVPTDKTPTQTGLGSSPFIRLRIRAGRLAASGVMPSRTASRDIDALSGARSHHRNTFYLVPAVIVRQANGTASRTASGPQFTWGDSSHPGLWRVPVPLLTDYGTGCSKWLF